MEPPPARTPHSQTLSRGILALEILAESTAPISIDDIARELGVHRSIAYRIVRTLEDHGLVVRDGAGAVQLGARMAYLARNVSSGLQASAVAELTSAAEDLGMTCFLAVLDHDECITIASVEPRDTSTVIARRPGSRHSLATGAPGIAIQSMLTPAEWSTLGEGRSERPEAAEARRLGYASSHDEVIAGLSSVAVPLRLSGQPPIAVAAVFVSHNAPTEAIAYRLTLAARSLAARMH